MEFHVFEIMLNYNVFHSFSFLFWPHTCALSVSLYLNDSLTGGEWQPHEAGVVDGHDLVSNAELARTSCWPTVHHVG